MSQNKRIKAYLLKGNRLTSLDALLLFSCMRLGARIRELRKEGLNIQSRSIYKGQKRFAEYYISQQ